MKFVKKRILGFRNGKMHDKPNENWYLIIDNATDLLKYLDGETEAYTNALLIENTEHPSISSKKRLLDAVLETKNTLAKPGEKIFPHEVMMDLVSKKGESMVSTLLQRGTLQINTAGGYSDVEGFEKIWVTEIIHEIEKESVQFPIDLDPIEADVLILENALNIETYFIKTIKKLIDKESKLSLIYLLKEKDPLWVMKSIASSKIIAFETHATDQNQIDAIMQIFRNVERKEILIMADQQARTTITSHKLWVLNDATHNIKFI